MLRASSPVRPVTKMGAPGRPAFCLAGFTTEGSIQVSRSNPMRVLSVAVLVMAVALACFAQVW